MEATGHHESKDNRIMTQPAHTTLRSTFLGYIGSCDTCGEALITTQDAGRALDALALHVDLVHEQYTLTVQYIEWVKNVRLPL
jgi:Fe-S cluster biogenesis protein NfuA